MRICRSIRQLARHDAGQGIHPARSNPPPVQGLGSLRLRRVKPENDWRTDNVFPTTAQRQASSTLCLSSLRMRCGADSRCGRGGSLTRRRSVGDSCRQFVERGAWRSLAWLPCDPGHAGAWAQRGASASRHGRTAAVKIKKKKPVGREGRLCLVAHHAHIRRYTAIEHCRDRRCAISTRIPAAILAAGITFRRPAWPGIPP